MGIDTVPGFRILLDGVDVAVAAKGVLFINPPAMSPIRVETRVCVRTTADFADALFPDGHSETFLHPNFESLRPDIMIIGEIPCLPLLQL